MVGARTTLVIASLLVSSGACSRAPRGNPPTTARDAHAVARDVTDAAAPRHEDPCDVLEPAQRTLVVARVGDQMLTLCDFTRRINSNNPYLRARFNAPEQRRALLQSWLDAELLAAEARARGLDQEPEARRAVTMQLARRTEMNVRNEVAQPEVTDAEVRAYYEAHRGEYETEAQVRASQITFANRADAERVLAEVRAHEDDDALFRERVRRLSTDTASRAADGDLGFFARTGAAGVEPEVAAAAFALSRSGEIAAQVIPSLHGGPDRSPGFHIVRLTSRRDALHRTLEEETRRIRGRLLRERREQAEEAAMRALVERLRAGANVQIDEAALSRVQVTAAPEGTPPALQGPFPPGIVPPARR